MKQQDFNIVNFTQFVDQYMDNSEHLFPFEEGALQIYPLSIATTFIRPPIPLFRARYSFLLLFSQGGGVQQVDDKVVNLRANDALFIREGHLNGIKSIEPDTDGYFIYIDNASVSAAFPDRSTLNRFTFNPKHSIDKDKMGWICRCCELIMGQKNTVSTYKNEMQLALIQAIVLKLAEGWPSEWSKPDRQSEVAMLFKELLYENFRSQKGVKFYADALAVSENYLNRCVKSATNKPPKQHINEQLISHGKLLLKDQSKDIAQIAFDLNFSDPSYFARLFKKLTKQTPSQYRRRILQD